jgi:uncharacterized membrane protein YhaH (DUF805 family)
MEWMTLPLKRYFDFNGRSRRKEFWMWVLGVVIATIVLGMIDSMLGLGGHSSLDTTGGLSYGASASANGGLFANLFALAIFIPNLAVAVRRLHDINRSGLWILLPLPFYLLSIVATVAAVLGSAGLMFGLLGLAMFVMPLGLICAVVLLVFFCLEGTSGPNRFGPDPKEIDVAAAAERTSG